MAQTSHAERPRRASAVPGTCRVDRRPRDRTRAQDCRTVYDRSAPLCLRGDVRRPTADRRAHRKRVRPCRDGGRCPSVKPAAAAKHAKPGQIALAWLLHKGDDIAPMKCDRPDLDPADMEALDEVLAPG